MDDFTILSLGIITLARDGRDYPRSISELS